MKDSRAPSPAMRRLALIDGGGAAFGADLLDLGRLGSLGALVPSIGGAGGFAGVFPTSVIAAAPASLASG